MPFFSLGNNSPLFERIKCNGNRTAQWRIPCGRRMGSMEISEMVWMSLPSSRRNVMLKLLIKTETSRIVLLESQENNHWVFSPGQRFCVRGENEKTTRLQRGEKGKPEVRAEKGIKICKGNLMKPWLYPKSMIVLKSKELLSHYLFGRAL